MTWPTHFYTHHRDIALFAESTNTMTICGPHGYVTVSDKCLAQGYEEGRAFVVALVAAADNAWKEAQS